MANNTVPVGYCDDIVTDILNFFDMTDVHWQRKLNKLISNHP